VRAEVAAPTSRAFALTTGTIGLVAIAVLVLVVSPTRQQRPVAVSATTQPVAPIEERSSTGTIASVRRTDPVDTEIPAVAALATPLGTGRYALVSIASIGTDTTTALEVVLPSGRTAVGTVVERSEESALVQLSEGEPGHEIAETRPHDRDVVTVMSQPPVTVAFADVDTLHVEEGTAVIDRSGGLVGLCTGSAHGKRTRVIAVDTSMTMLDRALEPDDGDPPRTTLVVSTTTAPSVTTIVTTTIQSTVPVTTTIVTTTTSTTSTTSSTTTTSPIDD